MKSAAVALLFMSLIMSLNLAWGAPSGTPLSPEELEKTTHECLQSGETGREACNRFFSRHPIRSTQFWNLSKIFKSPLPSRTFPAPPEMIEYLKIDNRVNGYPTEPKTPDPAALTKLQPLLLQVLQGLPPPVLDLLQDRLAGIALVQDLGSTGYSETIYHEGKAAGGWIMLDLPAIQKKANDWMTWREQTAFQSQEPFSVRIQIADSRHDNVLGTIRMILLHEMGHILQINNPFMPVHDQDFSPTGWEHFSFLASSWSYPVPRSNPLRPQWFRPKPSFDFPSRDNIRFYRRPEHRLPNAQIPALYESLSLSPFVSLYGAMMADEDWAEMFALTVHTQLMKQPYQISIFKEDKLLRTYPHCLKEPRCAGKRKTVEDFLHIVSKS